jgi:hypothetical protein
VLEQLWRRLRLRECSHRLDEAFDAHRQRPIHDDYLVENQN